MSLRDGTARTARSRHDELRDKAAPIRRLWPAEHHRRCNTRAGKSCDCYMRSYAPASAALDALLGEVAAAEARAAELERERDEALAVRDGLISPVQKVLALKTELAAMRARAEKAEQALRELVTATTTWDDDLSSYCDGDDRTRVREALVAARDVLAAAAGDTEGEG